MPGYNFNVFCYRCLRITGYLGGCFTGFLPGVNLAFQPLFPILPSLEPSLYRSRDCSPCAARSSAKQPFFHALADLLLHPWRVVVLWNWKAAWLSIILRAPIFLVATIPRGWTATCGAVLAECFYCAAAAGLYGALIQSLREAEPPWLTISFLTVVVPGIFQIFEAVLHWIRGTPHLRTVESFSIAVSAVSSLFNCYAMRRGTLLVGREGDSFGSDLRHLPRLLLSFVIFFPQRFFRPKKKVGR
jgi:hypothetical protein